MTASNDDFLFAQEAQALGYVSEAQVEEGFQLQRIMAEQLKIDERLAVILVKRGWLAEEQARRVFARIEPEGKKTEIPGYRLLERLGRGAMGTVYRAQHLGLQREVAIKVLHKDLAADTTQVARLKAEAKLLASLDHPNIVRALDAGETNGFPYVVMEYVEGETLRERLQREGRLSEHEALKITRGLADALERARRMGVVHRDVKPGNVLVTRQGEPKLMDLGLAKGPIDLDLTLHGATVGTPQYISPEQAQDPRKADIRSDIYSLGATLYAMLTGRPPFEGTTLAEIISKVLYETPTPPRVLNSEVSAEVGYLIERMMLKDPSLRYHTPAEVVDDIDRILDGRSIMPPGFRGNWEAFLLRRRIHRWVKLGSIALAGALALGLGAKAWHDQRQTQGRIDEGRERVALLLPETEFGRDDTLLSVQSKLLRLDEALGRLQRLDLPEAEELRGRRAQLQALLDTFQRWHRMMGDALASGRKTDAPSVKDLVDRGNWRGAYAAVSEFIERQIQPPGSENPVRLLAEAERGRLRRGSQDAFVALQKGVLEQRPVQLEDWVQVYAEYARKAEGGFILEAEAKEGVRHAGNLHSWATQVGHDVVRFESAYSPQSIQDRLRRLDVRGLRTEVQRAREQAADRIFQAWNDSGGWPDVAALLGPGGLVQVRLDAVAPRVREQVKAHAEAVVKAQVRRDPGGEEQAIERLDELELELGGAGYEDLIHDAARAGKHLRLLVAQAEGRRAEVHAGLFARWLSDLSLLDAATPAALREDASLSAPDRLALRNDVEDFEDLRAAADAVDRLYTLAMLGAKGLHEARQRLDARMRAGGAKPEKGWVLLAVDVEGRTLDLAVGADRERGVPLFALAPASIVALARRAAATDSDRMALALGLLALLPPIETGALPRSIDLRATQAGYEEVQRSLDGLPLSAAISRYVGRVVSRLQAERKKDERQAAGMFDGANTEYRSNPPRLSSAWRKLRELRLDRRLLATDFYAENKADIERLWGVLRNELKRVKLGRWFPGAHVEQIGPPVEEVWSVKYDVDTEDQLLPANFAGGKGVLEPYAGTAVITPGSGLNQRLHLLRGFTEPSRDHPLVWRSIFDPAAPITVTFDLFALDTPYLLAVDIDGVQGAVLSLDPNWYPQFQFPPDVPLLEGEKRPPLLDGQGRGRGVAFHGGPDFGDLAGWALGGRLPGTGWTPEGRGRHHAEWTKGKPGQRLFAFEPESRNPGHVYKVKVVRERGKITLSVDNVVVATEQREEWSRIGSGISGSGIVNGTGLIQILTWTPAAIDDLIFLGTVKDSWIRQQERKDEEQDRAQEGPR